MKDTNEKGLIIKKDNVINRIFNFLRNIFTKSKIDIENQNQVNNKIYSQKEKFESNLKIDTTRLKLLEIQENLCKNGINEDNLVQLTKSLTTDELIKLKELYIEQNERLKDQFNMYKNKILILKER